VPLAVRRGRLGSLRTRGVVACAALLALTGCSAGPVEIDAPEMSAADARACRDLVADLPDTMAGQERRDLTGDTAYGAAWGDPAIVLTCGVGQPDDFTDTSTCVQVDRAGWFVPDDVIAAMFDHDQSVDVPMTEMNFRPRVHVLLPAEYRPDGFTNTTAELAPIIGRDLERAGRCL
jgi:hypothetical protein